MFLDWQSDGLVAMVGLIMYAFILVGFALWSIRKSRVLSRLMRGAMIWHLLTWAMIAFWILPHYAALEQADNFGYHIDGMTVANALRNGDWGSISWKLGTDVVPILTGMLYAPFGGDIYGMLFFSAAMGLCAGIFFCRAYELWASPAQLRIYSMVVLFLPSFVMWTGNFGKDNWIALGLGMTSYGYALALKRRGPKAFCYASVGLTIVTLVRPHIGLILVTSMTISYLWGISKARRGSLFRKLVIASLLVATSGFVLSVASGFLGLSTAASAADVDDYVRTKNSGNDFGGSTVEVDVAPGISGTLRALPRGIIRVLLQPFPWEAKNVNAALAAAENIFIFSILVSHAGRIRAMLRGVSREPYIRFSLVMTGAVLIMLCLIPNLGLLSRQRAQLLPFLFVPIAAARSSRKRSQSLLDPTLPNSDAYRPGFALGSPQTVHSSRLKNSIL